MTDTGCLLVDDFLVVWPSGTAWAASADALTFAEVPGTAVSVGGRFEGGGGSIPMRVWRGRLEPEIVTALEGCLDDTGASSAVFAYPET